MDRFVKPRLDKELLGKERDLTAGQMMRLEAVIFIFVITTFIIFTVFIIFTIFMIFTIITMIFMIFTDMLKGGRSPAPGEVPVDPAERRASPPRQREDSHR